MSSYPLDQLRAARSFRPSNTVIGIMLIISAMFIFSIQDIFVKLLSDRYPVTQISFLRSLIGFPMILGLMWWRLGRIDLSLKHFWLQIGRAILAFGAYMAYYLALSALPLAEVTAIFFASPLFVVLLSVCFLGTKVGWHRSLSIFAGFIGVMIIVRPGFGFLDPAVALPIISALGYAALVLLTQRMDDVSSYSMTGYTQIVYVILSLVAVPVINVLPIDGAHPSLQFLTRAWIVPTLADWGLFAIIGLIFLCGFLMLTQAYKMADPTIASPFEYFMIPISMVWGITLFSEIPDVISIAGISLIVGSGLYIWYREMRAGKTEDDASVVEPAFGD